MAVNTLATGLIVFKILRVLMEFKPTSVEQSLDSARGTKLHHIIFIIIESGMVLFAIQLVRLLITNLILTDPMENLYHALGLVIPIHQLLNVIIQHVHIHFCFTDNSYLLLGHRTNSNFSAVLNETVLR